MRESQRGRARRAVLAGVLLAAFVLAAGLAAGCSNSSLPDVVSPSGEPVTKEFDFSGFTTVKLDGGVVAAVYQADTYGAAATLDASLTEYLVADVQGDTLHIGLKPGKNYLGATFRVTVTLPQMEALEVSGGSKVRVYGFSSDAPLSLTLTQGSYIGLSGVKAGEVTADVSGASGLSGDLSAATLTGTVAASSRLGVTGAAPTATLDGSGGSNIDLVTYTIGDLSVKLSGGSRGTVVVTGTLDADVSGGSRLEYGGSPTLGDVQTSGGSQVKRMGE